VFSIIGINLGLGLGLGLGLELELELELGLEYWLTAKVNILYLNFFYNQFKKIAYTIL